MGYDKYVKEALDGEAEVYYPDENCRFAEYVLRYAHEWKQNGNWGDDVDLVHWNAGLWDVPEILGDDPVTPIDQYEVQIARIDKRLRLLFPSAKIVFATSTAVQEEKFGPVFKRKNSTIEAFNAAAIKALEGTGTVIDDLYAVTATAPEECHSDMTHYSTPAGIERVGGKVIECISSELGIEAKAVDMDTFYPEAYPQKVIGN